MGLRPGLRGPGPCWGAYNAPLAGFKGPLRGGMGGLVEREEGKERGGERERKGGEGKEGEMKVN